MEAKKKEIHQAYSFKKSKGIKSPERRKQVLCPHFLGQDGSHKSPRMDGGGWIYVATSSQQQPFLSLQEQRSATKLPGTLSATRVGQ
jgi:hypothetical protein